MSDLPDFFTPPPEFKPRSPERDLDAILTPPPAESRSAPAAPVDAIKKLLREGTTGGKPAQTKAQPEAIDPQQPGYAVGRPRYDNIRAKITK